MQILNSLFDKLKIILLLKMVKKLSIFKIYILSLICLYIKSKLFSVKIETTTTSENNLNEFSLKSDCECNKNYIIQIKKEQQFYLIKRSSNSSYKININDFKQNVFTCQLYNVFKRGINQKIISFSLYGKQEHFYNKLKYLVEQIELFYPNWTIRIYHDDSIYSEIICDLECTKKNIDFCNINKLPVKNTFTQIWNVTKMHAMIWRWLPIGDSFADMFISRDLDSFIIKRELDSVNYWLFNTSLSGHIIRDNKGHSIEILGGLWGLHMKRNRNLASNIFNLILSKKLIRMYNIKLNNRKMFDQYFLREIIYPLLKNTSLVHDSYHCLKYKDSLPFPNKRDGFNYVGYPEGAQKQIEICPVACRPKYGMNWEYC